MSLLRLCHAGRPKTFAFTSSISTCMGAAPFSPNTPSLTIPESPIGSDPSIALSTGYAQSKYISESSSLSITPLSYLLNLSSVICSQLKLTINPVERITQTASSLLSFPIKLLRVGQLSGHTQTGHWSTDEMWPIMFATSFHPSMNALPLFPERKVDWIPVDIAAATITDILLSDVERIQDVDATEVNENAQELYNVHNIVNPHSIPWSSLIAMLQSQRQNNITTNSSPPQLLQEISMKEWTRRLVALSTSPSPSPSPAPSPSLSTSPSSLPQTQPIPGLRLLQFFEDMAAAEGDGKGEASKVFETGKTRRISEALRGCEGFKEEWVRANLEVWRDSGFLSL